MTGNFEESVLYYCKRVAFNNFFKRIAKLTHIDKSIKKIYFKLSVPKNGIISNKIKGISVQFYAKNYDEFVYLSGDAIRSGNENDILELLIENIRPGDIVYDIGAFLGLHAVFFAKKVGEDGRVVAFEPALPNYQSLKNNTTLNNLKNVITLNTALGDKAGEGIIGGDDPSMYSLNIDSKNCVYNQKIIIFSGDSLISEKKIPQPNIVKIDVEGYEYSVIRGLENALRKKICRIVCCEVHPDFLPSGVTSKMVIDLLKNFGFTKIEIHYGGSTFHILCYKI